MRKLCGVEKNTGKPLRILYAGTASQVAYVRHLFFSDVPSETDLGHHFAWSVNRIGKRQSCDLVIAVQSITAQNFLPGTGYCLPLWIESIADTSESPYESLDHSMKKDLKRTVKESLACVEAVSRDDFEMFWKKMYVPYAHEQFSDAAQLETEENFFKQVDEGSLKLFFAAHDGKLLAGGAVSTKCTTPRFRYLGVLNGNPEYRKTGAPAATYIFMLDWAHRHGHESVNLGGSRPFLRDGVLQYKKKYNISLTRRNVGRVLYINPLSASAAAAACLVYNPIIRTEGDGLVLTIFEHPDFDMPVPDSMWQYRKRVLGGLDRVEHVSLP